MNLLCTVLSFQYYISKFQYQKTILDLRQCCCFLSKNNFPLLQMSAIKLYVLTDIEERPGCTMVRCFDTSSKLVNLRVLPDHRDTILPKLICGAFVKILNVNQFCAEGADDKMLRTTDLSKVWSSISLLFPLYKDSFGKPTDRSHTVLAIACVHLCVSLC